MGRQYSIKHFSGHLPPTELGLQLGCVTTSDFDSDYEQTLREVPAMYKAPQWAFEKLL